MWILLNFQKKEYIRRYHFYKLMKILMININKLTENEMYQKIARYFVKWYDKNGIVLSQKVGILNRNSARNLTDQ